MKDVTSYSKLYVISLVVFGLLSFISFAILLAGIFCESRTLIFLSGIGFSGFGSILGFLALPIGFVTELITGGVKGSLNRYVRWVLSTFLLTGTCVSLFALAIPPGKINAQTLLPLMLMSVILGVMGLLPFFRACTGVITFGVFVIHIASLFLPVNMGGVVQEKISDACFFVVAPKRIAVSYESIKNGEIEFFRKDGKPRVWYYKKEDGAFELFNGEGHHPTYDANLKPVTQDIVTIIEKQFDKEEKERQAKIEQDRIRQEQAKQEQIRLEQAKLKQIEQERHTLDEEESLRKDLLKPGVYMIEKNMCNISGDLKLTLHRVDILEDRTIRVSFLVENDTKSAVWLKLKAPDGYLLLEDNHGNKYSSKPLEPYYYRDPSYKSFWLTLDFEPLKRHVGLLIFRGLIFGEWENGHEHGLKKFEYTLTPARRL